MAKNSKIEWTNHTANLWWGCTKVHEGCDNCYALSFSKRIGNDIWGDDKPRRMVADVWDNLKTWQNNAKKANEIHRVFVASMMDIFEKSKDNMVDHKGNPIEGSTGILRDKFFNEVVPASPNLMFLLLTKRPSNINKMIPKEWLTNPPKNVMFGTSPVNTKTAKGLIKQLQKVNGYKFLSVEPQLENITNIDLTGIDWVIQGGESGHGKRPFDPDWGRTLRDICKERNVPYFFKQIDKKQEIPEDLKVRQYPKFFKSENELLIDYHFSVDAIQWITDYTSEVNVMKFNNLYSDLSFDEYVINDDALQLTEKIKNQNITFFEEYKSGFID
ncbi:protein gp37 [Flavobacterium aquaticum]|uniref:Protein gp37 n=1 Tax=Flavobacterium aquaticum TaxID=1236486 RepID=A0A327YL06_9FLAO|nr:DUF5131 family protein [Flavobacterium aquaticum]RAK21633.1 protein gp37 [Flavobacterium aquaticum]